MKEPDDQNTDEGRSGSRSDGRKSSRSNSNAPEDITDDLYTDGEESYFDDDLDLEDMEEDSISSQDVSQSGQVSQELPAEVKEEPEQIVQKISENFFYDYSELVSTPYVTPEAEIPLDFLTLEYPLQLCIYNMGRFYFKLQTTAPGANMASSLFV